LSSPIFLGIDDTDTPASKGTGYTTRLLADTIEAAGRGCSLGVTRHQLFTGPSTEATRHNSAAAIALDSGVAAGLEELATAFLRECSAPGADPGLALLAGPPPRPVLEFARRAQTGPVERSEAERLAAAAGIHLVAIAGAGTGVVGALCAAVLRADGNDGRFIGLRGIRDLTGKVEARHVLESTPIAAVLNEADGGPVAATAILETGDWVRPRLIKGHPVLFVKRDEQERLWVNADVPLPKD